MEVQLKKSISNIAWSSDYDEEMYCFLEQQGIEGIEIAPTRLFPDAPYERIADAKLFARKMKGYGLEVCSLQSIWYGRNERIFGSQKERETLLDYTKYAFEFAKALECSNLVFGCPKNRIINSDDDYEIAVDFFAKLGEMAKQNSTVLAIEANPDIYGTNFLNTTNQTLDFVKRIDSDGIKLNYDLGTVMHNNECGIQNLAMIPYINHVHISEPNLNEVMFNSIQSDVIKKLREYEYQRYVSIEMKNLNSLALVKEKLIMFKEL